MNKFALTLATVLLLLFPSLVLPAPPLENPSGPDKIVLDQLEDVYGPVDFNHKRHATRFADACGDCHHQHRGLDRNPCKKCHALETEQFRDSVKRNFSACGNCHGDYDRASPEMPSLKVAYHQTCFSCHRKTGDVGETPASCGQLCHEKK